MGSRSRTGVRLSGPKRWDGCAGTPSSFVGAAHKVTEGRSETEANAGGGVLHPGLGTFVPGLAGGFQTRTSGTSHQRGGDAAVAGLAFGFLPRSLLLGHEAPS